VPLQVSLASVKEVDKEVKAWLREAWEGEFVGAASQPVRKLRRLAPQTREIESGSVGSFETRGLEGDRAARPFQN